MLIIGTEQRKHSVICTGVVALASPAARAINYVPLSVLHANMEI